MNRAVSCLALVFIALIGVAAVAAEAVDMEVDAEGRPLRKPIIMSHGSSPDHIAAIGKIGKILSREPLSANAKKVSEEDDSVTHSILPVKAEVSPSDIKAHIAKENMMHRNAALARLRAKLAKKLAKKGLLANVKALKGKKGKAALKKAGLRITKSGKIVRRKSVFDDDDEKVALEKEIRLLEKLIAQGRKIWSALPEKEARLAALRRKIAEMAAGKAKDAAKKKLKALLALLDKVNDKIEALNAKLKQLLKRKAAIQKQIRKYRAIIAGKKGRKGRNGKPKAPARGKKGGKKGKGKKGRKGKKGGKKGLKKKGKKGGKKGRKGGKGKKKGLKKGKGKGRKRSVKRKASKKAKKGKGKKKAAKGKGKKKGGKKKASKKSKKTKKGKGKGKGKKKNAKGKGKKKAGKGKKKGAKGKKKAGKKF